jgi:hypothetical protein
MRVRVRPWGWIWVGVKGGKGRESESRELLRWGCKRMLVGGGRGMNRGDEGG